MAFINPFFSKKYSRSPFELSSQAIKFREKLITSQTLAEKRFEEILKSLKIEYAFQYIVNVDNSFFIVDFYLPQTKLGIEIDGPSHYKVLGLRKDRVREEKIWRASGIKIYRWSNKRVLEKNREIVKFLKRYVTNEPTFV